LIQIQRRGKSGYLLSPTHEEEITAIVAASVSSYRDLPLRLYQVTRKYRDEARPRHGLLRAREFVMKDLYTFDQSVNAAMKTYDSVSVSYRGIFNELKIPYVVAEADSGDMGGSLSHEYHLPSNAGEDWIVSCDNCDYRANREVARTGFDKPGAEVPQMSSIRSRSGDMSHPDMEKGQLDPSQLAVWSGVSKDRLTLVNVFRLMPLSPANAGTAQEEGISVAAVKSVFPSLDASVEDPFRVWQERVSSATEVDGEQRNTVSRIVNLYDHSLAGIASQPGLLQAAQAKLSQIIGSQQLALSQMSQITAHPMTGQPLRLAEITDGDACPKCAHGRLRVQKGIELGHTFFLGTKYSQALQAYIDHDGASAQDIPAAPTSSTSGEKGSDSQSVSTPASAKVPIQMGCYGIGLSRMIGAIAEQLADKTGLSWPRVMAPFEVIIVAKDGNEEDMMNVYDRLVHTSFDGNIEEQEQSRGGSKLDVVLDDRSHNFMWKLKDADLIGYPVIVLLGSKWKTEGKCEVQCRRLNRLKIQVPLEDLPTFVASLLQKL
ncbi:MAG: hypothetical protein M1823_005009, partial [Watsoniomyces obsoletus]